MSGKPTSPEGSILEIARIRLREITSASTIAHDGTNLYLQQIAQAGSLALDEFPSCLEVQQLAETMAQQVSDVCNSLQNVACVDDELENDLLEFLVAINQMQEEIPTLSDVGVVESLVALEENIQDLSARIVWRIVANENFEVATATGKEANDTSSSQVSTSQAKNDNKSSYLQDLFDNPTSLPSVDTLNPIITDTSSEPITTDMLMALRLQFDEFSGTAITFTIPTDPIPDLFSSGGLTAPEPSISHLGLAFHFEETHQRGMDLLDLFDCEGDLQTLSNGISLLRESLLLCTPDPNRRVRAIGNLAVALITQYWHKGVDSDLSEAITLFYKVLRFRPFGHPQRPTTLNNLSGALITRCECEGSFSDLVEAIEHYQEALILCPLGHPDRAFSLNNLSSALFCRYTHEGSLSDLTQAIDQNREALNLRPPGHPDRAGSLENLSAGLLARFQREGCLSDLAEAIERDREALSHRPPGHPNRARTLHNLSTILFTRYETEGCLSDLSEAIEQNREALNLLLPGSPYRAGSLNNLSIDLLARFQHEGSLFDLVEGIERGREALNLRPPGHPNRAQTLHNLSTALFTRYETKGCLSDLSEAIEQKQEALNLCLPGNPHRAACLINLSNAIFARYEREGSLTDLADAIQQRRDALNLCPIGHPNRSSTLCSLSRALSLTAVGATADPGTQGHQTLTNEVFEMLREAANLPTCPPRDRLRAALQWIEACCALASESALEAYNVALDQQDIVLATSSTLENKHTQLTSSKELTRCAQLGIEAASYTVRQGDMALAVELLERGRNILFTQIGRYRIDLKDLRTVNAELADRFSNLSSLLDASVVSNQSTLEGRTVFEDPTERYRRVTSDWSRTVDDIRAIEGFDQFLRSPNYTMLRAAAAEGPVIIVIPGDDQSDALIISQDRATPYHIALPTAGEETLVKLCNALVQAVRSDDEFAAEKSIEKILRSLWDRVVDPIAEALEKELHIPFHSRIWWCPTSFFSFLPLHAAGRYTSEHMNENLLDRYVSSYTPTLQALLRSRRNHSVGKGEKLLIVAQPDAPGQSRLPNAQPEADLVKKSVELRIASTLYSSKEGTHAAVLDGMAEHAWLHLICHGSQNFGSPLDSCFCLHDGELTLSDIMRRGLPDAKFAFLAACHTATGDVKLMDEGLHLAAGLQFAGFKSVVGTIWEVADIDGPVLAEAFYSALIAERPGDEGMDCSRAAYALNKAVQHLRDSGVPTSRWMRFIHIGI